MTFITVTQSLLEGFALTCLLFLFTLILSLPLGLLISFCSMSKFKPLKLTSKVFVWIIRGVPLMLQLFIVFYLPGMLFNTGIPDLEFMLFGKEVLISSRFLSALIAFVLNYACYFSEIYRGGIEEQIVLPDEAIEYVDAYIEATADMDSAKARQQEASNHIKEFLGDYNSAKCMGYTISWKPITSERIDTKALREQHPEIAEQFTKSSVSRRFTLR